MTPKGFQLQYAAQRSDRLVSLVDVLAGAPAGRPGVIFAPVGAADTLRGRYEAVRPQGEAFLDPSGYLIDRDQSPQRAKHYPWLDASFGRPADADAWRMWMERSVEHQTGPTGLIGGADNPSITVTPCPFLTAATVPGDLYPVLDAAAAVRAALGRGVWLSLNVDRDFMRRRFT